jgi:hypothetical protein
MKVIYQKDDQDEKEVEFSVIGTCLSVQEFDGNGSVETQHRIALTQSQWGLLAEVANRKANGDY